MHTPARILANAKVRQTFSLRNTGFRAEFDLEHLHSLRLGKRHVGACWRSLEELTGEYGELQSDIASHIPLSSALAPLRFPAWQRAYEATLQATDQAALFKLVEVAESAMLVRRDLLNGVSNHTDERNALEYALRVLSGIKRERLLFSRD